MSPTKTECIGKIQLFAGLSRREIDVLASHAVEKRYQPGEVLFGEGEPCEGLYLILEGSVKIYKTSSSGREIVLAVENAPSNVAEVPLFDGGPYPASVGALTRVRIALIHTDDFRRVCRQYPEVALKILAAAGRRLRQLVGVIEQVTFGSVRQRLAGLLLELGRQAASDTFRLTMTHQELAARLGTVREVVSRNISRFQAEKLIRVKGRNLRLLDPHGLRREAETEL